MNGNDVGVDVDGMSEAEDDHVGCKAEGCPNRCAFGVDLLPRRRWVRRLRWSRP